MCLLYIKAEKQLKYLDFFPQSAIKCIAMETHLEYFFYFLLIYLARDMNA